MHKRIIALAIAVCTMSIVAVPTTAAQENCENPAEGVEVCDTDDDPAPEQVDIAVEEDGVGELTVTFSEQETPWFKHRSVKASGGTAESSAVGPTNAEAKAKCEYDDSEFPCTAVNGYAFGERTVEEGVNVGTSCDGLGSGPTPACTVLSGSADARYQDTDVRLVVFCGSMGFIGVTPCPQDASFGGSASTPGGDASVFGGAQPLSPSVFLCESDPATGFTCAP